MKNVNFQTGAIVAKTVSHYSSPQAVATVSEFDESLTAGACTCCSSSCGIVE
ncbi:hypothetical protein [Aquimarina aggregata]|uniref:hypothetical protein n=1 Tax=Aquimarina aggregata TaxID=1642818 RepID=UPI00249020B5|nr:hypothetical protein [Aquimarina aggregata]